MRRINSIVFLCLTICAQAFAGDKIPDRIVCLAPNFDETLIELAMQDKIVGVTTASDYLDEVKNVERVGAYVKPNIEKIVALKPDLVLATDFVGQRVVAKKLSNMGLRVKVVDDREGLEEIFSKTRQIGDSLSAGEKTEKLLARMREAIKDAKRSTAELARPRVYVETGFDPLFTCGRGSFINDLIEIAGGTNIAGEINQTFPRISSEFVLSRDPEVIILTGMVGLNYGAEALLKRKGWEKISAVRTGRVYNDLGPYFITIPSPRLILRGLPELLKRIHPELAAQTGGRT